MRRGRTIGERVRLWRHPDLAYSAGVVVAGPRHGFQYDVRLDDGRLIEDFPVGFIEDDWTDEQERRAVTNARRAGFTSDDGIRWKCDPAAQSGLSGCTLQHLVEMFDHDLPDCACGAVIQARDGRRTDRCFSCNHWLRLNEEYGDTRLVMLTYTGERGHYLDGGRSSGPSSSLGFGGAELRWRMLSTGEERSTNNMWFQGDIPERFHDMFPINAEMIR